MSWIEGPSEHHLQSGRYSSPSRARQSLPGPSGPAREAVPGQCATGPRVRESRVNGSGSHGSRCHGSRFHGSRCHGSRCHGSMGQWDQGQWDQGQGDRYSGTRDKVTGTVGPSTRTQYLYHPPPVPSTRTPTQYPGTPPTPR